MAYTNPEKGDRVMLTESTSKTPKGTEGVVISAKGGWTKSCDVTFENGKTEEFYGSALSKLMKL